MHTLTHASTGLLIGAIAFPHDPLLQILCVVGSNLPDTVLLSNWLRSRRTNKAPEHRQEIAKEISHSLFVWGLASGASLVWFPIAAPLAITPLIHVILDVLSHGRGMEQRFRECDAGMLWPFRKRIGDLIGYIWEYRHRDGRAPWPPKPLEIGIISITLIASLVTIFS